MLYTNSQQINKVFINHFVNVSVYVTNNVNVCLKSIKLTACITFDSFDDLNSSIVYIVWSKKKEYK